MLRSVDSRHQRRLDHRIAALLALLHLGVLWLRVGPILRHPSQYLLDRYSDGLKTCYVLLYNVQYDHGLWFTGMNYPHGEHMSYTDGFLPLAWVLRLWKSLFGLSSSGAIAALNLTVLLSSIPATPLLFAILRRCHVGRWWAGATALVIALFSPQFNRLGGHLTLSLPLVIPLLWYLQIRLLEVLDTPAPAHRPAFLRWLLLYVFTGTILGLVHPYYLLHTLLLPAVTGAVRVLQAGRRWRPALAAWGWLLIAGIVPLLLFRSWVWLTDPVTDRPVTPYGFFEYHANVASVFGPWIPPFADSWKFVFKTDDPIAEGWSYVGLAVDLVILFFAFRVIDYLRRGRLKLIFRPVLPAPLRATLWASVPILLLAMCWPFAYGYEGLVDYMPAALKQFRSLGRLAWVFYYVAAVWAATVYYQLYRMLRARRAGRFGFRLLALVLVVWALEARYQLEYKTRPLLDYQVADDFVGGGALPEYAALLAKNGRWSTDFQAILPVPFYLSGSEKIVFEPLVNPLYESFRASMHTGLPLVSSMMTRTSTGHTLRLVELFSSDLVPKALPGQFPSRKPLLLLASAQDSLRPAEARLVSRARLLLRTNRVRLYELPLSAFATTRPAQERAWLAAHRDSLRQQPTASGPVWCSGPGAGVVWQTFRGNLPASNSSPWPGFTQPGVASQAKGSLTLFDGPLPQPATGDTTAYEMSFWMYARTSYWPPGVDFRQFAPDGHEIEWQGKNSSSCTEVCGDWIRQTVLFHLTNPRNRIQVQVSGEDFAVDDLLIRPCATTVYWTAADGTPVRNGYPLR